MPLSSACGMLVEGQCLRGFLGVRGDLLRAYSVVVVVCMCYERTL